MTEVTCAIIMEDGKVLITQRSESMPHPLQWEFPGGKMKPGESPERCIIREIAEELNVKISVEQLLPTVEYAYPGKEIRLIPFICNLVSGEIDLRQHRSYEWINREQLEDYSMLGADLEVARIMNGFWK